MNEELIHPFSRSVRSQYGAACEHDQLMIQACAILLFEVDGGGEEHFLTDT